MSCKILLIVVLFAVVCLTNGRVFLPKQEVPCSTATGLCLLKKDCLYYIADDNLDLCPMQKDLGVECCIEYNPPQSLCRLHSNKCCPKAECNENLVLEDDQGCDEGEICCLQV